MNDITYVGLDVHKTSISVAVAEKHGTPQYLGRIVNTPESIRKQMEKLGLPSRLRVTYEAGPTGYGIYRQLHQQGIDCLVAAPSLIPRRPGDRVKNDRRDAVKLARLLRSGDLTPVWIPDQDQEALRDLMRGRVSLVEEVTRLKNRVSKFLLRQRITPPQHLKTAWTRGYRRWIDQIAMANPLQQVLFREHLGSLQEAEARVKRLEATITAVLAESPAQPVLQALQALRGVGEIAAATIWCEVMDGARFPTAPALMAYSGLVPRESSTGDQSWRGSITKAGNRYLRWILVECGWHSRRKPAHSTSWRRKQAGVPPAVTDIAWAAQERLYAKYWKLVNRKKSPQLAVVAVARELLGFVWAILREMHALQQAA